MQQRHGCRSYQPEAMFRASVKVAINAPKDGRGIKQQQVLEQSLSSTDVHGCIVLTADAPYISKDLAFPHFSPYNAKYAEL